MVGGASKHSPEWSKGQAQEVWSWQREQKNSQCRGLEVCMNLGFCGKIGMMSREEGQQRMRGPRGQECPEDMEHWELTLSGRSPREM